MYTVKHWNTSIYNYWGTIIIKTDKEIKEKMANVVRLYGVSRNQEIETDRTKNTSKNIRMLSDQPSYEEVHSRP